MSLLGLSLAYIRARSLNAALNLLLLALGVGIVAVAVAPLFLVPRLRRMNLPDTLRVME